MGFPTIQFNASTGADDATRSGTGPVSAITTGNCRTRTDGATVIGLLSDPDISTVNQDGTHAIRVTAIGFRAIQTTNNTSDSVADADATNGSAVVNSSNATGGNFAVNQFVKVTDGVTTLYSHISSISGGDFTLADNWTGSTGSGLTFQSYVSLVVNASITIASDTAYAIGGGALQKLSQATNALLLNNATATADARAGWIIEGQGTETNTATITVRGVVGSTTDGPVIIRAASGQTWTFTSATNSVSLFTFITTNCTLLRFENVDFTHTAGTRGSALSRSSGTHDYIAFVDCDFDGVLSVFSSTQFQTASFIRCVVKNCTNTSPAVDSSGSSSNYFFEDTVFQGNAGAGIGGSGAAAYFVNGCLFDRNAWGIRSTSTGAPTLWVANSIFYTSTNDGIETAASSSPAVRLRNSIFYGNGGYGIQHQGAEEAASARTYHETSCAFGSNTSGATQNLPSASPLVNNRVTLTANPFTDPDNATAANRNFSLNSTAGGGAACKEAAAPRTVLVATNDGDIGLLGFEGAGGSASDTNTGSQFMRGFN